MVFTKNSIEYCDMKFLPDLEIKSKVRLMIFSSGEVYKISGDKVSKVEKLVEYIYYENTHSIYKHTYINFNFKKISFPKLLASLFVENPNRYNKVIRKDNNIYNNAASNFEWVKNNRQFQTTNKREIKELNYYQLQDYDKAAYQLIIHGNESDLYRLIYIGKMKRYIYKSFFDRGIPSYKFEDFLDIGYEKLKERIIKYYAPRYNSTFSQFRKYCYLTMYFAAVTTLGKKNFLELEVIPRELRNENTIELEIASMFQILSGL